MFSVNPIGALFPTSGPADSSAAVYALTPATGETPGPEAEQIPLSSITAATSSIRVFLLIENRLLRELLIRLFRNRTDLLVVGQSGQAGATPCHVLETQSKFSLPTLSCQRGCWQISLSRTEGRLL